MRKFKIFYLSIFLIFSLNCQYDNEIDKTSPRLSTGQTTFAGVELTFNFYLHEIQLINHNDTVIKVKIINLNKKSILVNDLITMSGNTNHIRNIIFDQSDEIEIHIWQGVSSVYYGSIHGLPADYLGQGFLSEGFIGITNPTNLTTYQVSLPIANGADCELSGQYTIGNPFEQSSNIFYCDNVSSNTIRIELYKIKLNSTATGFEADYELASFWIVPQIGQHLDAAIIHQNFAANQELAIKVTSYDPFDNEWLYEDQYGFWLNIPGENFTWINIPIDLP